MNYADTPFHHKLAGYRYRLVGGAMAERVTLLESATASIAGQRLSAARPVAGAILAGLTLSQAFFQSRGLQAHTNVSHDKFRA